VAAFDATTRGHVGLASYYSERGESTGVWVGSGMVGIDGLQAGDAVTAEQMRSLFGAGTHPLAAQRLDQLLDTDLTDDNIRAAIWLGAPFNVRYGKPNRFQIEVARRFAEHAGNLPASDSRNIRAEVAREFFRQNTAARRPMDESWPPRSRSCPGRQPSRSPATTSPSPRSSLFQRYGRSPIPTSQPLLNVPIMRPYAMA
jgi:hypothetical protein